MKLFLNLFFAIATCVVAGEIRIDTPRLGYVLGGSGEVQVLEGLPGASWIGEASPDVPKYNRGLISPRQDYVFGIAPSGEVRVTDLAHQRHTRTLLPDADEIALSPTGASAAAYQREENVLTIWTGLPRNVRKRQIVLNSVAGELGSLAVSDDGGQVLAAVRSDNRDSLYRFRDGEVEFIADFQSAVFAFLTGKHESVVADLSSGSVFLLRDSLGLLATHNSEIAAVGASAEGDRLLVATSQGVSVYRADGSGVAEVSCDCLPVALERISDSNVFRLTDVDGTLWLFDGQSGKERVFFVPKEHR